MRFSPLLPLALTMASAPLYAQQPQEQVQEQLIVTGTYSPLTATQVSSTVSVIDRATITQLNKTNLADVLQTVPGVLVERQGGPGGLTVASIRGGESNYTVVMIDGVALNDPGNTRGGAFDLGNINVDSIERIEIVRGPQSAIYGADALAGVINIITLQPQKGHQQMLSYTTGDESYEQIGLGLSGRTEQLDYSVQLRTRDSGEPVEGSEAEDNEVNLRFGWRPNVAHYVSLSYRYFDGERSSYPEQSGGPLYALSPDLDFTDYTDESAALTWQYQITEFWKSQVQATRYQREEDYTSPGIPPYMAVPGSGSQTEFTRDQVSWINTLGQQGKFWANLGLEQRKEEGDSVGYLDMGFLLPTDFSLKRTTDSGFIDLNAQVNERLLLQGSVRYDDPENFDSETSTKVGLRFSLTDRLTLRSSFGEGYKLPSFFSLGHPLVGNPDLQPEKAESWDIGVEWQINDQLFTGVDYFDNAYRDAIDFDSELFTNVNRDRVDASGVEWQAHWQSLDGRVGIRTHATYTDIDVKDSVSILTGRPQARAGATVNWRVNDQWNTLLDYQWVDEQFASSQHTGNAVFAKLDDYHRVDVNLFWNINEVVKANFTVENLLDEDYQTAIGFPAPGLLWRVGLRWQLSN